MPTERDPDRRWVNEHMTELGAYDGEYIAVADCRVVAHGTNVHLVIDQAKRRGFSAPFVTRIENGKRIDVYQITGGVTLLPPKSESDPA